MNSDIENHLEYFFYMLWKTPQSFEKIKFNFVIPETSIYKGYKIDSVYFTAKDGTLRKRLKKRYHYPHSHIYDQLSLYNLGQFNNIEKTSQFVQILQMDSDNEKISIEYGISKELESKSSNVIIQKFVTPYMPKTCKVLHHNQLNVAGKCRKSLLQAKHHMHFYTIRGKWSTNLLILEKIVNINKFDQEEIEFADRVSTIEDLSNLTQIEPVVSESIINDIKVAGKLIAWQYRINKIKLNRANFYFRINQQNNLGLLFASHLHMEPIMSIKSNPKTPNVNLKREKLHISGILKRDPRNIDLNNSIVNSKSFLLKSYKCKESDYMGIGTYKEFLKVKAIKEQKIKRFLRLKKLAQQMRNRSCT